MHIVGKTADEVYRQGLGLVLDKGQSVRQSGDGAFYSDTYFDVPAVLLTIEEPRYRIVHARPCDPFNLVGQFWWTIARSSDLAFIEFYNPAARYFRDAPSTSSNLHGTWGSRLELGRSAAYLKQAPGSRRVVNMVFRPEDLAGSSRNLPCLISMQFMIRNGKLTTIANMRSQNAFSVLPYDIFLLSMLHEYVKQLSSNYVVTGPLHILCNSFHIYQKDLQEAAVTLDRPEVTDHAMTVLPRYPHSIEGYEHDIRTLAPDPARAKIIWDNASLHIPQPYLDFLTFTLIRATNDEQHAQLLETDALKAVWSERQRYLEARR